LDGAAGADGRCGLGAPMILSNIGIYLI